VPSFTSGPNVQQRAYLIAEWVVYHLNHDNSLQPKECNGLVGGWLSAQSKVIADDSLSSVFDV
jgi:hypothetical protein